MKGEVGVDEMVYMAGILIFILLIALPILQQVGVTIDLFNECGPMMNVIAETISVEVC